MSETFVRAPRPPAPQEPSGELTIRRPPAVSDTIAPSGARRLLTGLPMLAGAGAGGLFLSGGGGSPIGYLAAGLMALSMVGTAASSAGRGAGERRRRLEHDRRRYQQHLEQLRHHVRLAAEQQRSARLWSDPEPDALWCVVVGRRLWERRRGDADHLAVRVARGAQPSILGLGIPETTGDDDLEPVSAQALSRFVHTHGSVPGLPVSLSLPAFGRLTFVGPRAASRGLVRAMLAQLITFHAPDDLVVAVCCGVGELPHWEWLKWAPHALSRDHVDAVGGARLITDDPVLLESRLRGLLSHRQRFATGSPGDGPKVVMVLDGGQAGVAAQLSQSLMAGVCVLDLDGSATGAPGPGAGRLEVQDAGPGELVLVCCRPDGHQQRSVLGRPDRLSVVEAESLARRMSRMRLSAADTEPADVMTADLSLPDLLHIGEPHDVDPAVTWRSRAPRDRLRVPIGLGPDGQPVELDLKESAQGGMGPHGLIIGATGSGKSELLRTLVLGLALTHSSETLNLVLVDFKGGATFASLGALPHTSALITNLENELTLVDRMKDAITGELVRRQEALRAAGNYASARDYEHAREQGAVLEPMPSLVIVVDEFSELLSAKPDFIDLFVMIGRLGRSLGVHLLLASQRLEEGRLRGLETHLSYRVALRTFSAVESRTVLGVPDAHALPGTPGNGYLKEASEGLVRFKAAFVSGAYSRSRPDMHDGRWRHRSLLDDVASCQVLPYQTAPVGSVASVPRRLDPQVDDGPDPLAAVGPGETTLDILVSRLKGAGPPARTVWLPPLDLPPALDHLLPPLVETELGLRPEALDTAPSLTAPIGIVDRPFDQRRDTHRVDLASSHFVVVGRPQSGKSTVLRSLIAGLALTHTPEQAQFYCLDFGGGTLTGLSDLPHVGSVATRLEPERLRRTVAEISTLLVRREELFTAHRIDSMASYRRLAAAGTVPRDGFGDVFLVVDGWGTVREDHEALATAITAIAARGLGYGVHVALSVQRWTELRPALRDLIGHRLELRLGDPTESDVDRRAAADVPGGTPGRGLSPHKQHFLSALPRIDGRHAVDDLVDGVGSLVTRVRDAWSGPVAPPVRLLPRELPYRDLPPAPSCGAALPIGVEEDTLSTVSVDFDAEPHFLVIGDAGSGKSNLLRTIARGITTRWTPEEAKIVSLDVRRGMLGAVTTAHQVGYAMNSVDAPDVMSDVVRALRERLAVVAAHPPAAGVRTWQGPRLFLLLDDYDLIAASAGNPVPAIIEFLPQARDIGLHVVLGRSAGGAGQGVYETVVRTLRDMGTPGILLSGNRDEGAVLGSQKMEPLPPGRGRLVHRQRGSVLVQTARAGDRR